MSPPPPFRFNMEHDSDQQQQMQQQQLQQLEEAALALHHQQQQREHAQQQQRSSDEYDSENDSGGGGCDDVTVQSFSSLRVVKDQDKAYCKHHASNQDKSNCNSFSSCSSLDNVHKAASFNNQQQQQQQQHHIHHHQQQHQNIYQQQTLRSMQDLTDRQHQVLDSSYPLQRKDAKKQQQNQQQDAYRSFLSSPTSAATALYEGTGGTTRQASNNINSMAMMNNISHSHGPSLSVPPAREVEVWSK